jgi:signal transduction histidine kinase
VAGRIAQFGKLSLVIGIVIAAVALWFWWALLTEEHAQIEKMIQRDAAGVKNEIVAQITTRILALTRMARRWEDAGRPSEAQWGFETELNVGHFPGYYAIAWVDPSFALRWVTPLYGSEAVQDFSVVFAEQSRNIQEAVFSRREVTVTSTVDLAAGGKGFLVYIPLFRGKEFDGVIIGAFNFKEVLDAILYEHVTSGYSLAIFDKQREVYRPADASNRYEQEWGQETTIDLYGTVWQLRVWPRRKLLLNLRSPLPDVALIGGLLMAALLGWVTYLAQTARLRAKQVEIANRLKSDFLSTLSHELRTPLNLIMGYTELLLRGNFGSLTTEQVEPLGRVEKSTRDLRDLISAMLDVTRLEAAQMPVVVQAVYLPELLEEVTTEMQDFLKKPGVNYEWRVPTELPAVRTDPTKLKAVIKNLLSNAVKFTEQGRISVDARSRDGGVEIAVADTGVGISPDVLPDIFELCRQGDSSTTRRYGGVGLGLYIVRRFLELLRGTVEVESEVGHGSTFRVWVPLDLPSR